VSVGHKIPPLFLQLPYFLIESFNPPIELFQSLVFAAEFRVPFAGLKPEQIPLPLGFPQFFERFFCLPFNLVDHFSVKRSFFSLCGGDEARFYRNLKDQSSIKNNRNI
jgi:hypothetical protein